MIIVYSLVCAIAVYLVLGLLSFLFIWAYYKINNFYTGGGQWVDFGPKWLFALIGLFFWPYSFINFIREWKERKKRKREALKNIRGY